MDTAEDNISTLKKLAKKEHNAKLRQRYDVVRLFLQGRHKREVAAIMNLSLPTIYSILECYSNKGLAGLVPGHSTGRNKKLTEEQEGILYKTISEKTPSEVGFAPFCNWTAPLACQFVKKEFHTDFSERGMRNVFYRLALSYTRPTYVLANADPEKQENFREEVEALKKTHL